MAIISERKGVNNWLSKQGVTKNETQQAILSEYKKQTGIALYRTYYSNQFHGTVVDKSRKRFDDFVKWYKNKSNANS